MRQRPSSEDTNPADVCGGCLAAIAVSVGALGLVALLVWLGWKILH